MLGRLSFPIYLVHWPILMGIVFHLHEWLADYGESVAVPISFAAFIVLTLICAVPIMLLDEWWVRRLSAFARNYRPITAAKPISP
jgi:peptidoglycan/LPS O-acetylase OafA/YrhL